MTNKKQNDNEITDKEKANEFGVFGEISVKNCFLCGKTIRQKSCYGFVREKDKPKFIPTIQPQGYNISQPPNTYICLKCLLKGVWAICQDKEKINEFLDLYIKTSLTESI